MNLPEPKTPQDFQDLMRTQDRLQYLLDLTYEQWRDEEVMLTNAKVYEDLASRRSYEPEEFDDAIYLLWLDMKEAAIKQMRKCL